VNGLHAGRDIAATQLTPDASLWTNDKRLAGAASRLGLLGDPTALRDEL